MALKLALSTMDLWLGHAAQNRPQKSWEKLLNLVLS